MAICQKGPRAALCALEKLVVPVTALAPESGVGPGTDVDTEGDEEFQAAQ